MRNFLTFFLLIPFIVNAQSSTQEFSSKIKEVTIFIKGAEIHREASISLKKGKNKIAFTGLSPFLNSSTIQLKGQDFTILSLSHKTDFLGEKEKSEAVKKLEIQQKEILDQHKIEKTNLTILKRELEVLMANKLIGGTAGVSAEELQKAMDYFGSKLRSIENAILENGQKTSELDEHLYKVENEINELMSSDDEKTMRIEAVLQAETALTTKVELQYIVSEVGWFPSYDIRVENITKPINITYKANVYQNTGVDWKNVQLTVSSSNPEQTNTSPTLNPNYLEFDYNDGYKNQTIYQLQQNLSLNASGENINEVSGIIFSEEGEPLPGVNVIVKGSTIGTVTDLDGKYKLTLPSNASTLSVSYIGYKSQEIPINRRNINLRMAFDDEALEEVVVTGYGYSGKTRAKTKQKTGSVNRAAAASPTVTKLEYQTNFAYEIEEPYNIASNGKLTTVELINHEIESSYTYNTVPKLVENAFLVADITDWNQYNFLEGEANLYFENSFIGRSVLDTKYVSDTLRVSLGRDDNIVIKRTRLRDFEKRKFFGSKKKEERVWEVAVKNLKNEVINLKVYDQIPLSTNQSIKVEDIDTGGATHDESTGELSWTLQLNPNEQRKLVFKYAVEYPKNQVVKIE